MIQQTTFDFQKQIQLQVFLEAAPKNNQNAFFPDSNISKKSSTRHSNIN